MTQTHVNPHLRWIIKREPFRQPRFGETRRDVTAWAVRPCVIVDDGRRVTGPASFFPTLSRAHTAARRHCEARYGRRTS